MALGDIDVLKALSVEPGSVFRMELFPTDGVVPKDNNDDSRYKYFIIIGKNAAGNYIALTLINTDINPKLQNIIGPYQHMIFASEYPFLNGRDRYVDCYKIKEVTTERVINEAEYIANVSNSFLEEVRKLAISSPTISQATIDQYSLT